MIEKVCCLKSGVVLYIVLLAILLPVCGCNTWMSDVRRDVDVNSGDVRERTFCLFFPTGTVVSESVFSHEVRRLQIPVKEERVWKHMTVSRGTRIASREYVGAIEDCDCLVQLLNAAKVSDADRHATVATALSNLQLGKLQDTYDLIEDIGDQVRVKYGMPPVPEELKTKEHRIRERMRID